MDEQTVAFEAERPRLLRIAERILGDHAEAEDVIQNAWIRLARNETQLDNLPGWLTTVTTRLCLDRLRSKLPEPEEELELHDVAPDPADDVMLVDTVGDALQVVLDRLSPSERVAFVLHDSFAVEFGAIATILGVSPAAARKLASRARGKVTEDPQPTPPAEQRARRKSMAEVIDAFLAAARNGEFDRLLTLLAPDAIVAADAAAAALGTPQDIKGRREVATVFNGAARTAFPVFIGERAGLAWLHRGEYKVAFDFTVSDGLVQRIDFRADPEVLAVIRKR
jgi:RNA polymerase sigma-70 factor (ECF subfamily)